MKRNVCLLISLIVFCQFIIAQSATDTFDLRSNVFNEVRNVKVALPQDYRSYPNRKYIVAYLFDAQSDAFFNYVKATLDYLSDLGYIEPLILVGVVSSNRQYEFTPPASTEAGKKSFAKSGGAGQLAEHLSGELMPAIRTRFRCYPYTVGIGHSLGGTFLTYALYARPELFNASIIISPNYQYDEMQLLSGVNERVTSESNIHKFFYVAHGKGDPYEERFRPGIEKLKAMLGGKKLPGLRWQVVDMDNDNHGTTAPEGILKGMVALYRQFFIPYDSLIAMANDSTRPLIDKLKEHYRAQSSWAGIELPLIGDINGMGYNLYYSDKKKQAIAVFEWALSMYPDDTNLHDSMGEIQQLSGNKNAALTYYKEGIRLVEKLKPQLEQKTYKRLLNGFNDRIQSLSRTN